MLALGAARGHAQLFSPDPISSTLPEQPRAGRYGRLRFLPIATALCAAANFVADTITTTDIAFAALYSVVVLMAARFCSVRGIIWVAAGCVALTFLSYFLTPPGGSEYQGIFNTAIGLAAIGLITFLTIQQKTTEAALREHTSEIQKLNNELAKRARDLETSNNELESFAYSVSHDLRAPLRHVVGYSELLQKQASSLLDKKSRRFMQTILESAKRMGNLIMICWRFPGSGEPRPKRPW